MQGELDVLTRIFDWVIIQTNVKNGQDGMPKEAAYTRRMTGVGP